MLRLLSESLLNSIKLIGDFVQAVSCPGSLEVWICPTLKILLGASCARGRKSLIAVAFQLDLPACRACSLVALWVSVSGERHVGGSFHWPDQPSLVGDGSGKLGGLPSRGSMKEVALEKHKRSKKRHKESS